MTVTQRYINSKKVIWFSLATSVQDQCGFLEWLPRSVVLFPTVKLEIGITVRHHVDHLQKRTSSVNSGLHGTEDLLPFTPPVDSERATTDLQ